MAELRLKELLVENFRSIRGRCIIPLDGEITLIHGSNGAGKTSILSAIELAATGRVSYLEDQSADPGSLLRNHDYAHGQVQLSLSGDGFDRTATFDLTSRAVGEPVLSDSERAEFLERSFLPQTALARLLETYTDNGRNVDSALVRFVKSLVGLDDLDELIDGIQAAGHVSRSKKLVPSWNQALEELENSNKLRKETEAQIRTAEADLEVLAVRARQALGQPGDAGREEIFQGLRASLTNGEPSVDELGRLERMKAVLDAVIGMRHELGAEWSFTQIELAGERVKEAAAAYDTWAANVGSSVIEVLNRVRKENLGMAEIDPTQFETGYTETRDRLAEVSRMNSHAAAANRSRNERMVTLQQRIHELDSGLQDLESQALALNVPADARIVIEVLGTLLPFVGSSICPVCDQEFKGETTLAFHIEEKLLSLNESSAGLVRIETAASAMRGERMKCASEMLVLANTPADVETVLAASLINSVNGMEDVMARGATLRREAEASQEQEAAVQSRHSQYRIMTQRVNEVADALGYPRESLPTHEPETALRHVVVERINQYRHRTEVRRTEKETLASVETVTRKLKALQDERKVFQGKADLLTKQITSAKSRMSQTRGLLQQAEQTRSQLINQVFDQSLNSLWAQLFTRFAPTERFTPRFVKQTKATRAVDVRLETQLPDGTVSGAPGAMLSYGNTNSAALALFMAIHLSAPAKLPWLIFDDPVQSMDDIHIANFAAIVRQLAYAHGRQVIIAVHQPELFEYLSLELAPSHPGQSLVKAKVERGERATRVSVDRVNHHQEQRLA